MASLLGLFQSRDQRMAALKKKKKKKEVVKKPKLGQPGLGSTIRAVRSRNNRLKNI